MFPDFLIHLLQLRVAFVYGLVYFLFHFRDHLTKAFDEALFFDALQN